MKLLIFFLLSFQFVSAQNGEDSAFVRQINDLPAREPFDTANAYHRVKESYIYLMSDNDIYNTFGFAISEQYQSFDFRQYHILGIRDDKTPSKWKWLVRKNNKAFEEIPSATTPGHVDADLPRGRKSFFSDTLIRSLKNMEMTNWYTTGHGDCHASFSYKLLHDKYYPVIILKEINYDGGCRAAGFWDFTISFRPPAGYLYHLKNILLVKK